MINKDLYEQMEEELRRCRIEEETEDVLLDLAEILAEKGVKGRELHHCEKYGKTMIQVCGICTSAEEEPEETAVLIKWVRIGKKQFDVDDFLL